MYWLHWVFAAVNRLSLVVASRGYSLAEVRGFLIVMASLVAEHGLWGTGFSSWGTHGLSYLVACVIFPEEGLNLCPLHWQVDS